MSQAHTSGFASRQPGTGLGATRVTIDCAIVPVLAAIAQPALVGDEAANAGGRFRIPGVRKADRMVGC